MHQLYVKAVFILVFLSGNAHFAKAQGWQLSWQQGKILDHSEDIRYSIPQSTYGLQAQIYRKVPTDRKWYALQGKPDVGLAVGAFRLGNDQILGYGIHALPLINYRMNRDGKITPFIQGGTGIAYLTKRFDGDTNPTQTAIGSKLNNITQFRLGAYTRLSPNYIAGLGIGFTHYSNGGIQQPNLGINVLSLNVDLRNHIEPSETRPSENHLFLDTNDQKSLFDKWGMTAYYRLGYRELRPYGGAKYPIRNYGFSLSRKLGKVLKIHAGYEREYHTWLVRELAWTTFSQNQEAAEALARRKMLYLSLESWYHNISVTVTQGWYLNPNEHVDANAFNRLQMRYHFPNLFQKVPSRFFLGFGMKSHVGTAEYLFLSTGISL